MYYVSLEAKKRNARLLPFSIRIKSLRGNMSQTDLARHIGVEPLTIHLWETKCSEPTQEQLKQIAKLFNVSIEYILGQDK